MTSRLGWSRLWALAAVLVAGFAVGCSSSRRPPIDYPVDPDPSSTYCLKYLPPTYREVPKLVECSPSKVCQECSWRKEITFEEVCTPGRYEKKCTPCREKKSVEIVVEPARTEWVKAPCACEKDGCCFKPVTIPARTKCCDDHRDREGPRVLRVHPAAVQRRAEDAHRRGPDAGLQAGPVRRALAEGRVHARPLGVGRSATTAARPAAAARRRARAARRRQLQHGARPPTDRRPRRTDRTRASRPRTRGPCRWMDTPARDCRPRAVPACACAPPGRQAR